MDPNEQEYEAQVGPVRRAHIERYGLPLGQLLQLYVRLFAKRRDVRVLDKKFAKPANAKVLRRWRSLTPAHVLALYESIGSGHLRWVFADAEGEHDRDGGRLLLDGIRSLHWRARPSDWTFATFEMEAAFEPLDSYGSATMSFEPGQARTDAEIVFFDKDAAQRISWGTAEHYLTEGAKRAFVWTWQLGDSPETEHAVARLMSASVSADTPTDELETMLAKQRLTETQARALVRWLGDRVVLLLPKRG